MSDIIVIVCIIIFWYFFLRITGCFDSGKGYWYYYKATRKQREDFDKKQGRFYND